MRFLNVAFVMTALTASVPLSQAQDGISPEVFAACEAKTPNDFKQQLACVKEQAEALNAINELKKTKSRQIAVQPKADETVVSEPESEPEKAPEKKPEVATAPAKEPAFDGASSEDFCEGLSASSDNKVDWKTCIESEASAHAAIGAALTSVDSDIPGDPYVACRNYIMAYQPETENSYVPQVYMLQCLEAKAPTRDFAKCYQTFEHRIYNRDVTTVSEKNAGQVADCFVSSLAGGP